MKFKLPTRWEFVDKEDPEGAFVRAYTSAHSLIRSYKKAEKESRGACFPKVVELINELEALRGYPKKNLSKIETVAGRLGRECKKIRRENDRQKILGIMEEKGILVMK